MVATSPARKPLKVPLGMFGLGLSAVAFSFTLSWTYFSYQKAIQKPLPTADEELALNLANIWKTSDGWKIDGEIGSTEYWAGITKRRRQLLRLATGNVLETAVGTGRNLTLYESRRIKSVTMVDQSAALLKVCKEKWDKEKNVSQEIPAQFLVGDLGRDGAAGAMKPPVLLGQSATLDRAKFDTVVQTFALCSTPDPVKMLRNLSQVVKPDGKILLLEHGLGHYDWLNKLLHHTALDHAKAHGCWYNRDIAAIVEKSGLEVEEMKRFNFGTTWWIILRPRPVDSHIPEKVDSAVVPAVGARSPERTWKFWS
jgi:methyltransferase OMS1